jgi:XTP/dITP diphosphohydrolase
MVKTLLIASTNHGKLREIQAVLFDVAAKLVLPETLGLHLRVEERGSTYAENAALKAEAYCAASGLLTLADDSGLEVDTLDGEPGLYSARYANLPGATDADRRQYLLHKLQGKRRPWTAHFHCTVAVAVPGGEVFFADGNCYGEIIPQERGHNGFGYDPLFYMPEFRKTMAELPEELKNQVSHRALALMAARPILDRLLSESPSS